MITGLVSWVVISTFHFGCAISGQGLLLACNNFLATFNNFGGKNVVNFLVFDIFLEFFLPVQKQYLISQDMQ